MAIIIPGSGSAMCWTSLADYTDNTGAAPCRFLRFRWTNPCSLSRPIWMFSFLGISSKIYSNACDSGEYYRSYPGTIFINHRRALSNGLWASSFTVDIFQCGSCNVGDTEQIWAKSVYSANELFIPGGPQVTSVSYVAPGLSPCASLDCSQTPTTRVGTFTVYDDDTITATSP